MTAIDGEYGAAPVATRLVSERPSGHTTGWWGMMLFLVSESMTFGTFMAAYFYLWFTTSGPWPPPSDPSPDMIVPSIYTACLLVGCVPMWWTGRAARTGRRGIIPCLVLALLLGLAFLALQGLDWVAEWPGSTLSKDAYGSIFYALPGLHAFHVLVGVFMVMFLLVGAVAGHFRNQRHNIVTVVRIYWYFIAAVAVPVLLVVYGTPNFARMS